MVGHMNLDEQVDADFSRARRRAFLRRLSSRLRGDPVSERPPCFEETRRRLGAQGGIRRGRRVVRSNDIVGSVGRCAEFDEAFLPTRASVGERWKRVDRLFHRAEALPPVSLYKIGDSYFALDGNHRVSVYRYHGVEWIDAVVTEFRARSPNGPGRADEAPQRGESKVHETMDFLVAKQRRGETACEVETNRPGEAWRAPRKRSAAYLPFVSALISEHARQAGEDRYPGDDGTLEVHAAAMDLLIQTRRTHGISADVPGTIKALLERGIAAGHGADGIASLTGVIKTPAPSPQ